jgi:hypothetical protein
MGRCLTAANAKDPIVLDMVDNLDTTSSIGVVKKEFEELEKKDSERNSKAEPRSFEVFDYTLDIKKAIQKLSPGYSLPVEERIAILKKFVEEHGHLPRKEDDCYYHLRYFDKCDPDNEEYRMLNEKYRKKIWMKGNKKDDKVLKRMDSLEQYYANPESITNPTCCVSQWICSLRKAFINPSSKYYKSDILLDFFKKHGIDPYKKNIFIEDRIKMAEDYCREHGYRPSRKDAPKIEDILRRLKKDNGDDPRVQKLLEYPIKRDYMRKISWIEEVEDFYRKNSRFPLEKSERSLYDKWLRLKKYHIDDPEVIKLAELCQRQLCQPIDENIARVEDFYKRHGRFPYALEERINYENWYRLRKFYPDNPRVQALIKLENKLKDNKE